MPIYEYKCTNCEKIFELFQKIADKPLKNCDCGGKVVRIFHPPGIVFKGSGFYSTDNKKSRESGVESREKTVKTEKQKSGKAEKNEKKTAEKSST